MRYEGIRDKPCLAERSALFAFPPLSSPWPEVFSTDLLSDALGGAAAAAAASQSFSRACAEIGSRFITGSIKESTSLASLHPYVTYGSVISLTHSLVR